MSAQTWTQTITPLGNWYAVACSANGQNTVAADNTFPGAIYNSSDYGNSWSNRISGSWASLAASADGQTFFAVEQDHPTMLYESTDAGQTWYPEVGFSHEFLVSVACSADGANQVAVDEAQIYSTYSSGLFQMANAPNADWISVAASANFSNLVGVIYHGGIWASTDAGVTWNQTKAPTNFWGCVASSADGTKLVAGTLNGSIYTSADSGNTWTSNSTHISGSVLSVASSADGTRLVAGTTFLSPGNGGHLYFSVDSGATWTTTTNVAGNWTSVASSADGGVFYATYQSVWTYRAVVRPKLNLALSSNNLTLSWILPSSNFVLQQNADLTTTNWLNVPTAPTLNLTTLQNEVTLPTPAGNAFFRLASQ